MKSSILNPLLVFIAGASYGFIVPVIKTASSAGILPNSFLTLQYIVAFVAAFAFCLFRRMRRPSVKSFLQMTLLGVCTGLTSICYYTAIALLPSAVALTLLFQYVWVSVLIECVVERHLPSRSSVIAIIIVLIGTCFAAGLFDGPLDHLDPKGVAFGIGSAFAYALYLYLSGRIATDQPTEVRTTGLAVGGIVVTFIANPSVLVTSFWDPSVWPFALALAVLGILLPATLINFASPKLTPGMVSIMASSELPVGILAAWAFVADTPTPLILFGAFLVLFGIFVKSWPTISPSRKRSQSHSGHSSHHPA